MNSRTHQVFFYLFDTFSSMYRQVLFIFISVFSLWNTQLYAQNKTDSVQNLREVIIKAYPSHQSLFRTPTSASVIDNTQIKLQATTSPIAVMNTVAGLRMEERSPGSYRLSIRGSLLRSPFGIRNVKIYFDGFPLTDAGGNTYLNLLDMSVLSNIEVLKGPDGSLFGANSGGVVLLNSIPDSYADSTQISANLSGGSFGLFHENAGLGKQWKNFNLKINQSYQRSDGYRSNSGMHRKYFQASQTLNYSPGKELKALFFYSDLNYRTPGGLTADQMANNPRAARPATQTLPGAMEQKAGIYNQTVFAGLSHIAYLNDYFKHVISISGSHTDFKNPFITNFEFRDESSSALRTYFELGNGDKNYKEYNLDFGMELQGTQSKIRNFDNHYGSTGALQSADLIRANQFFFFANLSVNPVKNLFFQAALSENFFQFRFAPLANQNRLMKNTFNPQLMPRLALSYLFNNNIIARASISKGYSPPTISELRSSNNIVNTTLQPESGWNHEAGFRFQSDDKRWWLDGSVFYYNLTNAIVRRLDNNSNEYFINAGGTRQTGIETALRYLIMDSRNSGFIRRTLFQTNYTLSKFYFSNYKNSTNDYSGNKLTGVPENILVSNIHIDLPGRIYLFVQHNYTSAIPLNDANTVFSKAYHLLQLKTGWQLRNKKGSSVEIYTGADNLLNVKYSLGNDLNAVGGRFFNPSPLRNYFGGVRVNF